MARRRNTGTAAFSFAVLAIAAGFGLYAKGTQTGFGVARYPLSANFVSANGLERGADVVLAGVPVGNVSGIRLDPRTQMAVVDFDVNATLHFPSDSLLSVGAMSMTGENALTIEPGSSERLTQAGDVLGKTREPVSLEQQISNYIFGNGGLPVD